MTESRFPESLKAIVVGNLINILIYAQVLIFNGICMSKEAIYMEKMYRCQFSKILMSQYLRQLLTLTWYQAILTNVHAPTRGLLVSFNSPQLYLDYLACFSGADFRGMLKNQNLCSRRRIKNERDIGIIIYLIGWPRDFSCLGRN